MTRDLLRDFERDRDELLPRMKRWFLPQYMQLIAKLLPKNGTEGIAAEDVVAAARAGQLDAAALAEALAAAEAAEAAGEAG